MEFDDYQKLMKRTARTWDASNVANATDKSENLSDSSESSTNSYAKADKSENLSDSSENSSDKQESFGDPLMMGLLGLGGETGEVLDYIKKVMYHQHEYCQEHMVEELGDVLWYVAFISDYLGISLNDIAFNNIEKLQKRYPQGFDPERSKNREGKNEI